MSGRYARLVGHEVEPHDDLMEWGRCIQDANGRTVARTKLVGIEISTVFLGFDHGFHGVPLWFESMIFGGPHDGEQRRYTTWTEAEAGHAGLVDLAQMPAELPS